MSKKRISARVVLFKLFPAFVWQEDVQKTVTFLHIIEITSVRCFEQFQVFELHSRALRHGLIRKPSLPDRADEQHHQGADGALLSVLSKELRISACGRFGPLSLSSSRKRKTATWCSILHESRNPEMGQNFRSDQNLNSSVK